MKDKILYGYLRESKEDSSGYSLDFQERVGEKIKNRFHFNEFKIFNEGSGISGNSNPFERDQGSILVNKIQNGEIKSLYVYEWSRLSRNNFYSEYLRKIFRENDVILYEGDCNEPKDLNNPIDNLTSSILGSIYTFERLNMIKRIKEGLVNSRENSRWNGVYLPFGYKRGEDRKVTLDETEIPIYLKMVDFVFEGKTIRWIVNWLNENLIPTKSSTVVKKGFIKFKNKDGTFKEVDTKVMLWRDNVVRNIITNTYYKGVRIDKYGKEYPFPSIITVERWGQLQKIFEDNISRNRTGNKQIHNYLLKNIVFCGRDNKKLLGRIKKDERTYYCSGKRKETRLKIGHICSLPSPNLDRLESFVWEKLTSIMSNSHLVKEEYKKQKLQNHSYYKSQEILKKDIKKIEKKIEDIKQMKEKILGLYLKEMVDEETYYQKFNILKDEEEIYKDELNDKNNNLLIIGDKGLWIDWINDFSKDVKSWKSETDFEFKREKVLKYIKKIIVDYDDKTKKHLIEIHLKYPMINDKLIWNDKNDKKKGYKIRNGKGVIKHKLGKKTSYQPIITSLMVWCGARNGR